MEILYKEANQFELICRESYLLPCPPTPWKYSHNETFGGFFSFFSPGHICAAVKGQKTALLQEKRQIFFDFCTAGYLGYKLVFWPYAKQAISMQFSSLCLLSKIVCSLPLKWNSESKQILPYLFYYIKLVWEVHKQDQRLQFTLKTFFKGDTLSI